MTDPKPDDYPFDPQWVGREHELQGLEKLRAIESPTMRKVLFDLWQHAREGRPRREENPAQACLPLDPREPVIGRAPE